jgi:hypothetical protein
MSEQLAQLIWSLLGLMAICLGVALVGLALIARRVRRLRVPPDADFFTTMRHVPLLLVLLLDLLDFGLDVFSAPVSWIMLDRMGLPNLRNKAVVEALIPVTGVIPTFTLAWFMARMLNLGEPPSPYRTAAPYNRNRPLPAAPDGDALPYAPSERRRRRTIDQ